MFKKGMISIFICLFMVTSVYTAEKRGLPSEAKKLVEKAVAYVNANGEKKALKEFNNPKGRFVKGDLYVFAYNPQAVNLANPMFPNVVGKDLYNEPDTQGKLFRQVIVNIANVYGSGWVDYMYMNPVTKKEQLKVVYFQKVGNLVVCCGAYMP
ncbi:MAG: cache domain-containing protein [Bacillota bacterium]|nr:cache domain-containing protein [Bacillota bacterium]